VPRFELGTSPTRTERATRLRHTPGRADRLASLVTVRFDSSRYVVYIDNEEETDLNVVTLIGNLASDVEVKDVGDDKRVANFLIAVDRRTKDGGADFVRIVVWERQAELCAQYLAKGKRVAVDGYLRSRTWEEDGKRRRDIDVVARSVQFLSPPSEAGGEVVPFEPAVA
jgi:single-strand DNA-binding protein